MPFLQENFRTTQTGGSGTDDRHLFPSWRADRDGHSGSLAFVAGDKGFQWTAEHRLMRLVQHAGTLAELFMRADP